MVICAHDRHGETNVASVGCSLSRGIKDIGEKAYLITSYSSYAPNTPGMGASYRSYILSSHSVRNNRVRARGGVAMSRQQRQQRQQDNAPCGTTRRASATKPSVRGCTTFHGTVSQTAGSVDAN